MSDIRITLLLIGTQFVASIAGPILGEVIKARMSGPAKPTPETAPPKRPQPSEGWFMRWVRSPWIFPCSFIVINVLWLLNDFHSHAPVTRLDIYNIASVAAAIWYDVFWMSLNLLRRELRRQGATTAAAFQQIAEGTQKVTGAITEWREKQEAEKAQKRRKK